MDAINDQWWWPILWRKDLAFQARWGRIMVALENAGVAWPKSGESAFIDVRDGGPSDDIEGFALVSRAEIHAQMSSPSPSPSAISIQAPPVAVEDGRIFAVTSNGKILTGSDGSLKVPGDVSVVAWCRDGDSRWTMGDSCPTVSASPRSAGKSNRTDRVKATAVMFGAA